MRKTMTDDELASYFHTLSNWNRWGDDDELGTLNFITPEVRTRAAGTVREGESVSLAFPIHTSRRDDDFLTPQRFMMQTGEGLADPAGQSDNPILGGKMAIASEYFGLAFHGVNITHLDGLSHVFWEGRMYNGKSASLVTVGAGATVNAVTSAKDGITTRGVLLDIAANKGLDHLEPGYAVVIEDLEEAEKRQGVEVGAGDAVFLRTGYPPSKRPPGYIASPETSKLPGWHVSTLPWLHERSVALIGSDASNDCVPSGFADPGLPVHAIGIVAMGLWLVDSADLESLSSICARLDRWEFLLTINPILLEGGTGCPVNPIATF